MHTVVITDPSQLNKIDSATMVEFRLDQFPHLSLEEIASLRKKVKVPVIFTLRDTEFGGSETERLEWLEKLSHLRPDYLDIEHHVEGFEEVPKILSYHNYEETPNNLKAIYLEMLSKKASIYKIATHTTTLDAMELLLLTKNAKKPTVAMGMGPAGDITRILAPIVGAPFVYTALRDPIPGQMTLKELQSYGPLNQETEIYGLMGSNVHQSKSPAFHNSNFRFHKKNAVYVKFQLDSHEVGKFLELAKELPIKGLSVTTPLKEVVMDYVDEILTDIGAINTLLIKEGKIYGTNTDGLGALNALEYKTKVAGKQLVILGAGGAAKAIAYEAKKRGAEVTVLNRTVERAKSLGYNYGSLEDLGDYDILINATTDYMPTKKFIPNTIVMDIHNSVSSLPFLKEAKKHGCTVVYGYHMFLEQAIGQYNFWGFTQ